MAHSKRNRRGLRRRQGRSGSQRASRSDLAGDQFEPRCQGCDKIPQLCICDLQPAPPTRARVLVLQHPQEPREPLSTAPLIKKLLPNATVRTGLSWRNLRAALGAPEDLEISARDWLVLFLGAKEEFPRIQASAGKAATLAVLDSHGEICHEARPELYKGVIILDGTWSQAKTLWWRNSWLLKCSRCVLLPQAGSRYGNLRREPRRESISSLEALAQALIWIEGNNSVSERLVTEFEELLGRYRGLKRPEQ